MVTCQVGEGGTSYLNCGLDVLPLDETDTADEPPLLVYALLDCDVK